MKRFLFYFVGLYMTAMGISSIIVADLGAGSWDTVFVGLYNKLGLTPGTWSIIVGGLLMFLNGFLAKEKPDFLAFLTVFTLGVFIDFNLFIYSFISVAYLSDKLMLFAFGFVLLATGVGVYLQAKFSPNPIDKLMVVVHKRFGISIALSRFLCEATALTIGFLLAGPVSYGTVIIVLFIGPCIQFSYSKMELLYNQPKRAAKRVI
ncbi:hypothetical protein PRVXH_002244 [Proteinivorax hydrogeniformans]|uniref:Membrane protein YczE n=1 Tax=Proteinivorax hydrogeniformans TaxID=1826727 RepID=A0AAU8HRX3_9FIRM